MTKFYIFILRKIKMRLVKEGKIDLASKARELERAFKQNKPWILNGK